MEQTTGRSKKELVYRGYPLTYIPDSVINYYDFVWVNDPKGVDPMDYPRFFTQCYDYDKGSFFLQQGLHIVNVTSYWLMKKKIYDKLKLKEIKHDKYTNKI